MFHGKTALITLFQKCDFEQYHYHGPTKKMPLFIPILPLEQATKLPSRRNGKTILIGIYNIALRNELTSAVFSKQPNCLESALLTLKY